MCKPFAGLHHCDRTSSATGIKTAQTAGLLKQWSPAQDFYTSIWPKQAFELTSRKVVSKRRTTGPSANEKQDQSHNSRSCVALPENKAHILSEQASYGLCSPVIELFAQHHQVYRAFCCSDSPPQAPGFTKPQQPLRTPPSSSKPLTSKLLHKHQPTFGRFCGIDPFRGCLNHFYPSTYKLNRSCHSSHLAHTTPEPIKLKFEFFQALDFARNRQATMESQLVTAVTPFRFLDLPREVRDDIYEAAIFDLSPPDMFMKPQDPDSLRLRKLDTNVLLTSSQVYWEARDVIVRRGQLIMVSFKHRNVFHFEKLLKALSGVTGIDPMYRNLCVMKHRSKYQILTHRFLWSRLLFISDEVI